LVRAVGPGVDQIIVVDNASPQGPPPHDDRVLLIQSDANLGYGAGANLGARQATGDVLLIANPDVSIGPDDVRRLAEAALEPSVALAAPRFVDSEGWLIRSAHRSDPGLLVTLQEWCPPFAAVMARIDHEWHATLLRSAEHEQARDVRHVLGALMAVRADAFRQVGGFDEGFFLYREETDLCRRLRGAGWTIRHTPAVTAIHIGGASTDDPWPMPARPIAMDSHYRFIGLRWGQGRQRIAWAVGLVSSAVWVALGRQRGAAWRALRWHLGVRR
jgi:N-acetylglucosaminyl-diphospho-decaprenol L-rhamnosyltransferase